jgi:ABC-type transport system involved in cytochrome c biogenesis permease subunit
VPGTKSIIEQLRLEPPKRSDAKDTTKRPRENSLAEIVAAYDRNEPAAFNQRVDAYLAAVQKDAPHLPDHPEEVLDSGLIRKESYFNHVAPFYHLLWLYLFAGLLAIGAWLGWSRVLNRTAFALILFTFVFHTWALWERMLISGRPPVTNLYSSAIFIGWGCVLLGLVFEVIFKVGLGNVVAAVAGCSTLAVAHLFFNSGDTIQVLQAVLDTGFWLATHVVIITLGYATTYVAGLLGIIYLVMGIATPGLTARREGELTRMIYGTIAFSIFFSFVGTVLGGLWADDSWGRFWGWDPKENGALIIVMWNVLVLHARWGGLVKDRGLAVLAIAGNIAVSWSWFGVNQLGKGLHSYGFTDGMLLLLGALWAGHMALIALGALLPKSSWWSYLARSHTGARTA